MTRNTMTRRHFNLIADALKNAKADDHVGAAMASALASTNSRFDRQRFIDACCHDDRPIVEPKATLKPDISKWFADAKNTGHERYITLYSKR
jgi:hypothetical protein